MGNYRFKFSDIIPNAWFYKLRYLTKQPTRNLNTKKKLDHRNGTLSDQTLVNSPALTSSSSAIKDNQLHHHRPSSSSVSSQSQYQRKSYHFTRDVNKSASLLHDGRPPENFYEEADGVVQLPRRSSKKRRSTRRSRASPRLVSSSVRAGYSCRSSVESVRTKYPNSAADTFSERESHVQPKSIVSGGVTSTETTESTSYSWSSRLEDNIVIDIKSRLPATHFYKHVDDKLNTVFDSVSKIELSPIKTKGNNINKESQPIKTRKQTPKSEESKKIIKNKVKSSPQLKRNSLSSHSPGLKLRTNTPKIVNQKIQSRKSVSSSNWMRSLSESLAVVTSSKDPEKDFRESMVEMIVEHNIWSSTELEDLLACYLSLNSYKHHDVIITVFKQIWFDFVHA